MVSPRTLITILGLAGFISAADNWFISPVLPAIASDFGIAIPLAGVILTAYLIPYGFMQPVFGVIGDRVGKVQVLQCILAGFALGSGACAFAESLTSLTIWRACTGFFAAGIIAVSLALIGDTVPESERQRYVGIFMGIVFFGQGLSVGVEGILATTLSWRIAFLIFSVIAVIVVLLLQRIPKTLPESSVRSVQDELRSICKDRRSRLFPMAFLIGLLLIGVYSFLGAFLHQIVGLDYLQIGCIVMFFGFSCLIGGTQAGFLEERIGRRAMVTGGAGVATLSTLLLALFPGWGTGWIAAAGLGLGYICMQSTIATLVFDIAPGSKGLPSALVGLGLFGGAGVGTALLGMIIPVCGYSAAFLLFALGMVGILILFIRAGEIE
ncbi:MFS transporter [Methanosphaerula palustris]|uniref:Major facilitator superfamily MFS_1 n=1 Tax=Methanosphaerula palustris (strain ATCC BAA-1556 / DSM 19958 / E1-9c) TaxID=521011 RepID=B8GJ43_METPE|nr:MFS transporter [Methanosphaerula palustris]ACL15616.1 major facilitator superfamily MFS_1 [Methanosphaerula palustris E1-9c]